MGIDYGMGRTNIDKATGIRYGVISQHAVTQAWCDSAEPDYGDATCPKCGSNAKDCAMVEEDIEEYESGAGCADYACERCKYTFDSSEAFGDQPQGWSYEGEGYQLVDCLDSDVLVIKSAFYTFAPFCSPCVPGACSIEQGDKEGDAKAYCLGHDWFEDGKAPYPVYRVGTDEVVTA